MYPNIQPLQVTCDQITIFIILFWKGKKIFESHVWVFFKK